jgi:CHAT domain-containing protein/tetratricopeptide (TPR) repeat protein
MIRTISLIFLIFLLHFSGLGDASRYHSGLGTRQALRIQKLQDENKKVISLEEKYNQLGDKYDELGKVEEALKTYDLGIAEAKKNLASPKYLLRFYARKAAIFVKMGDYEKAIAQANNGINESKNIRSQKDLELCFIEKAKAYIETGELEKGKENLDEALKLINGKPSKSLGYVYFWYAKYQKMNQNNEQAIKFYQKSQQFFMPIVDVNYSIAFLSMGMIFYNQKNYDKALENFQSSLQTSNNNFTKVQILDDIACAYWQKKEFPKAFQNFQKALTAAPIGFKSESLFDNPSTKSLKIADLKQFYLVTLQDKGDAWFEYYQETRKPEHLKIALNAYLTADKLVDIMRFEQIGITSKLYWRNQTHYLYEKAIETCFLLKDYEKAFYFFEKSKAVLLNDKLNELSAKQQLSPQDLAQEKDFQQQISELTKKISAEKESSQNYLNFQNKLSEIQTQQEQFIKGLETKNPVYFRYKYDTTLYNLGDVKKYLIKAKNGTKSGSTLVEYFVGDAAIYTLKITPKKTDFFKMSSEKYSSNAKLFLKYCADNQSINKNYQDFLQVSNQLYQQLFKDLNPPAGRLIIAQDGYFLPFEALSKSAQKSDYLLQDYAISYTYSVQFLLKNLGEKSFSIGDKFMGMSPVDFSKNLNQTSLTGSDISLKNVDENFYFGKTFTLKEATKKAFADNAHQYQIVHLYTHAQADSSDQEPMIYFADSVLKLSEISDLQRFKTQLLVLSACKTAVGRNAKGEGILSLSRGFATQGIPATLTTLWSVENQATYTLNELFYRYIAQGETKDVALQKAKLEFLKTQSGEKQLPTFWAAAVLVGDAEAISSGFQWWWVLGGGGVIVLLMLGKWGKVLYAVRQ